MKDSFQSINHTVAISHPRVHYLVYLIHDTTLLSQSLPLLILQFCPVCSIIRTLPKTTVENVTAQGFKHSFFYLTKFLPEFLSLRYTFPPLLLFLQCVSRLCPQFVVLQNFAKLFASFAIFLITLLSAL